MEEKDKKKSALTRQWPEGTSLVERIEAYPKMIVGLHALTSFLDEAVIFTGRKEDIISRKMFRLRLIDYCYFREMIVVSNVQIGWLFSYAGITSRAVGGKNNQVVCYCGLKWKKEDKKK